jgi:hypothetical protein
MKAVLIVALIALLIGVSFAGGLRANYSNGNSIILGDPKATISIQSPISKTYNQDNIYFAYSIQSEYPPLELFHGQLFDYFIWHGIAIDYDINHLVDLVNNTNPAYQFPANPSVPLYKVASNLYSGNTTLTGLSQGYHNITVWLRTEENYISYGIPIGCAFLTVSFNVNSLSPSASPLSQSETNKSLTFSSGVILYSPLNITYNSNLVYCSGSFSCPNELLETLNYTLDEKYLGFLPWKIDMATFGGPINYFNGSVPLPNLSDGSHKLSIGVKEELWDGTQLVNKTTWVNTVYFTVKTNQSIASLSPSPTPTIPEFSWLVVLPLLLSVFSIALLVRHRKTVKIVDKGD